MDSTLIIQARKVYGKIKYYPACDTSLVFARLIGQKTLTANNINTLKELGYTIKIKKIAA